LIVSSKGARLSASIRGTFGFALFFLIVKIGDDGLGDVGSGNLPRLGHGDQHEDGGGDDDDAIRDGHVFSLRFGGRDRFDRGRFIFTG
jgi:hypothetical protein